MTKNLNKRNEGFTIIEVMIVLAIAGLIMLIVFLAVPALQRNARNTQRSNDASKVTAAINECMSNNNGKLTSCDTGAELADYITIADNGQLDTWDTAKPGTGEVNTVFIDAGTKCNASGNDSSSTGASSRSFSVLYRVETNSGDTMRCLGS